MSADYDIYSHTQPVFGTVGNTLMNGSNFTPWILMGDFKSATFIASLNAGISFDALVWSLQESDNGITGAAVSAADVLLHAPRDKAALGQAWHVGYVGKKNYVRAALNVDGGTTDAALSLVSEAEVTVTLTSSSTTATATKSNHGFVVGQKVTITGASPAAYNVTEAVIASVPNANTFTYAFAGGTSPATGTIKARVKGGWTATGASKGADRIASITAGNDALSGNYVVSTMDIGSSAHATVSKDVTATGDGAVTISNIVAAVLAPYVNQGFTAKCTAEAANAGTFAVYKPDGASIGTVTVGATGATLQIGGQNAFKIVIADGANDWDVDDLIEFTFDDLGVNVYKLTAPNGDVVGYPIGGSAFTSGHLSFTIPDTSVAVASLTATATIAVSTGLAYGQITALLGNPLSGPVNQYQLTDKPQVLNS